MLDELFPDFPSYAFEVYKTEIDQASFVFAPMMVAQPDNPHNPFEHRHSAYELLFLTEGTSTFILDQRQLPFTAPMAILIPPGISHATNVHLESNVTYSMGFILHSQGEPEVQRFLQAATRGGTRGIYREMTGDICRLLLAAYREHRRRGPYYREKVGACCKALFISLVELFSREAPDFAFRASDGQDWNSDISRQLLAMQVVDYINRNCGYQFTINDLAGVIHMSVGNLQRILNSTLGRTFTEMLRDARISRAKGLIRRSSAKMRAIAGQCGYSSYEHFYKQFRQVVGMSPQEYRDLASAPEAPKMYGTSGF
ncbi:MAG: AraC family transcriptional regulator [Oscillospiraceae bacterium]|nr:AraC family transcriptional regulator [Oscillospiraceae bacterium]